VRIKSLDYRELLSSGSRKTGAEAMTKKFLIWQLASIMLSTVSLANAQQPGKAPRIGFLSAQSEFRSADRAAAFQRGLRDLGYSEGKNILIEYRWANGINDRLPDLVAELIRLKVDVIVTSGGNQAISAAKNATSTIPIVFTGAAATVSTGLVASFSRPGGNMTGVTIGSSELSGKRLELLKETNSKLSRVAYIFNPTSLSAPEVLRELEVSSKALGLQIQSLEVRQANEIEGAFDAAAKARAGALIVAQSPPVSSDLKRVINLAAKNRFLAIYSDKNWPEVGGLMSYGPSISDVHRRAATYVDKILKGAKPSELPIEQPMKFEFVINLKTAKQIGLTIPQRVLIRADKVIK
jgi:putative ABC transport system substrate-binding protein